MSGEEEEFEEVTIESPTKDCSWRVPPKLLESVKLQVVHIRAKGKDVRQGRLALSEEPTIADRICGSLNPNMKYVHMCYEIPERPNSFIISGSNRAYITDSRITTDFQDNELLKKFDSQTFIFAQIWGDVIILLNRTGAIRAIAKHGGKVLHKLNLETSIDSACQVVTTRDFIFVKLDRGAREFQLQRSGFKTMDWLVDDVISDFVYDHKEETLYYLGRQTGVIHRQATEQKLELVPRIRKNSAFLKLKISYSGNLIAVQKYSTKLSLHLVEKPKLRQLHSASFEDQGTSIVDGIRLLCPRHGFFLFLVQLGTVLSLFAECNNKVLFVDKTNNDIAIHSLAYHKSGYWIGIGTSTSI